MKNQSTHNNKFINSTTISTSIFGALLAFVISKLLDPLFEKAYSAFLLLSGTFVKMISDSTYQKISNGFSDQTALLVLYLAYLACFSFLLNFLLSVTQSYRDSIKNIELLNNDSLESDSSFKGHEDTMSIKEINENVLKCQYELDSLKQRTDKLISKRKRLYKTAYIFTLCTFIPAIILLVFIYSRNSYIVNKITLLTNNIEIVAPYISDQEYKQLKSDFHSIQNADDYEALDNTLIDIARSASIRLKE